MNLRARELQREWRMGEPSRADARLRNFARREGDAVFCRECDGGGILASAHSADGLRKCTRCGGEGLEPPE